MPLPLFISFIEGGREMDMEQRKVTWANRIFTATEGALNTAEIRRVVAICQDAFNEGHKAGQAELSDRMFTQGGN